MPKRNLTRMLVQVTVVVEPDGDGFHAFCPALKGLHVDGKNERETLENAKQAIEVYLDSLALHGDPLPICPHLTVEKYRFQMPASAFLRSLTVPWPSLQTSGIR